jgi:hypothetical protein
MSEGMETTDPREHRRDRRGLDSNRGEKTRRLLVVATAPHPEDELLERLRDESGEDTQALVVVPASDLSFLQWLTNDEDAARAEAERRAKRAAEVEALAARVVEARAGDVDPLVAIEDALRTFPADELVIVTRPSELATWLEEDAARIALERHFGRPVTHLVDDDVDTAASEHRIEQHVHTVVHEIAHGQSPWTGFRVLDAVFVKAATVAALLIALALVVYLRA